MQLLGAVGLMSVSLLLFNIAGVYITKLQSATHRSCVDATRQVLVWAHALLVGWERFNPLELLGYTLLLLGTLTYTGILSSPWVALAAPRALCAGAADLLETLRGRRTIYGAIP